MKLIALVLVSATNPYVAACDAGHGISMTIAAGDIAKRCLIDSSAPIGPDFLPVRPINKWEMP